MHSVLIKYSKKIITIFVGLAIASYGTGLTVASNLGLAPWDVFSQGVAWYLSNTLGSEIMMGTITQVSGMFILIAVLLLKEKIGITTVFDMCFFGHCLNFYLRNDLLPAQPQSMSLRIIVMLVGFMLYGFGIYLCMAQQLGAGPRDSLMVALAKRNIPVRVAKNSIEAIVFVVGWLMGGTIGIGSVIAVFIVGYIFEFYFKLFKYDVKTAKNESFIDTVVNIKKHFKINQ